MWEAVVSGNKNAAEWVLDYICFFSKRGYELSSDFASRFFDSVCAAGLQDGNVSEMAPVLRTLTVQTSKQNLSFDFDFDDFIHDRKERTTARKVEKAVIRHKKKQKQLQEAEETMESLSRAIVRIRGQIEKAKEKAQTDGTLDEATVASLLKNRNKAGDGFAALFEGVQDGKIREALENLYTLPFMPKDELQSVILELTQKCITLPNGQKMMKHLEKIWDTYKKNEYKNPKTEMRDLMKDLQFNERLYNAKQQEINSLTQELSDPDLTGIIQKLKPQTHREDFAPGAAVSAASKGLPEYFDKEFERLSLREKELVRQYIYANAREFRTRLARNIRTGQRRRPDLAEICRKACATNGIPMRICYKKPTRSRANLILLLDISGSCREASELMLFFAYCMHDVFPGGCRAYAFVNRLYDISGLMEAKNPEEAVQKVLDTVPTRGVYSDYFTPLSEFHNLHFSEINRDSIVIFIGDARNNNNPSGEEHLKAICRKSRRTFWINTESRSMWDMGDSIIGIYRPYLRAIMEARTAGGLLNCMDVIRGLPVSL